MRPQRKKSVGWTPGVAPPWETLLAVSITTVHEVAGFRQSLSRTQFSQSGAGVISATMKKQEMTLVRKVSDEE